MGFVTRVEERLTRLQDYAKYKSLAPSYKIAERAGINRPKVFMVLDKRSEQKKKFSWSKIDEKLPNIFVARPSMYLNSRHDFFIRDDGANGLMNFTKGTRKSPKETIGHLFRHIEDIDNASILFEEFPICNTTLEVPITYKIHMFYGQVGFIQAATLTEMLWFDSSRAQIGSTTTDDLSYVIPNAVKTQAICDAANEISVAIQEPYMRIDFMNTTRGPMFRSFASIPGDVRAPQLQWLYGQYDEQFDTYWTEAEQRIADDIANTTVPQDTDSTPPYPDDNA